MTSNYSGYSSEPMACWTPTAAEDLVTDDISNALDTGAL